MTILAPPFVHSLQENYIGDEGVTKLAAVLKETKISELKCAARPKRLLLCQRPLTRLLAHHPRPTHGSLGDNRLCGRYYDDEGVRKGAYTAEGITKLCEGLKGSAVTSLKCAAAPRVFAFVSAPADTPDF